MNRIPYVRWLTAVTMAVAATASLADEPIKIGAIDPYSGPLALYGDEVARGYELAADEYNAKGGVLKRQIVILRGDAGTPQQGIAAVERLVGQDKVDVFTGTYVSSVSSSASDAANRYKKLYWDTNALAQDLTERKLPNFIRSGPNATTFADVSVNGIKTMVTPLLGKPVNAVTVWIEHEDSVFGTSIAKRQVELLESLGVKVLGVGKHSYKSIDLGDSIMRAASQKPDIWLNTGYVPDTNLLLKAARDQGFRPPVMITLATGDTRETLEALGAEGLDGVYVVGYPQPGLNESYGPGSSAYATAYRAKYKREPLAPQGMTAYVGMKLLLDTIQKAGSVEPDKVRAAAAAIDLPIGSQATGYGVKFDANMQNVRALPTIVQWQGGKVVTVFPVEARAAGVKLLAPAK
ncbi:ABC transporter substrate-binding protein [soil metagenome]